MTEEQQAQRREYQRRWYMEHDGKNRHRLVARVSVKCAECGKELSLQPNQLKDCQHKFCDSACYGAWLHEHNRGELAHRWAGGRRSNPAGYIELRLQPDDFFYPMQSVRHYVLEHRLVMARHVKRCLLPWEVVHHINGVKDDNRLENLKLLSGNGAHNTMLDKWCKKLAKENAALKQRVAELERQLEHT